jgi:hypothetical protein
MADQRPQFGELESYLDGQLTGEMRARFEDEIARDPSLRAEIARQRTIDESLNRAFAVTGSAESILGSLIATSPAAHAGNGRAHATQPAAQRAAGARWIRPRLAIAAAIVFLVCGPVALYFAWDSFREATAPTIVVNPKKVQPLDTLYKQEVKDGFNCDWQCKTNNEFGAYFASTFGEPLMMKDPPQQVAPVGLKYAGGITPNTISYMARVNDQPVMVFTDKQVADKGQALSDPNLHIFKRTIGPLVLYEVTPLDEPKLLDLFYKP